MGERENFLWVTQKHMGNTSCILSKVSAKSSYTIRDQCMTTVLLVSKNNSYDYYIVFGNGENQVKVFCNQLQSETERHIIYYTNVMEGIA